MSNIPTPGQVKAAGDQESLKRAVETLTHHLVKEIEKGNLTPRIMGNYDQETVEAAAAEFLRSGWKIEKVGQVGSTSDWNITAVE